MALQELKLSDCVIKKEMKLPKQIGDLELRCKQTNSLLNCCIHKHDQESWCEVVKTVSPDKTGLVDIALYM